MQFLQMILSVFVLFLCASPIVSNPRQERQASGNEVDLDDEGAALAPTGCCDWPSCYDERTQLCLDTCLKTWSQCPSRLHLMSCYSDFISPFGSLPVQCYPDAAAHIEEAESLGLTGSPREIRETLHALRNIKNCHPRTGICRPRENQ